MPDTGQSGRADGPLLYDKELFRICRPLLPFPEDGFPQAGEVENLLETVCDGS